MIVRQLVYQDELSITIVTYFCSLSGSSLIFIGTSSKRRWHATRRLTRKGIAGQVPIPRLELVLILNR